jgi:hypothetical protein
MRVHNTHRKQKRQKSLDPLGESTARRLALLLDRPRQASGADLVRARRQEGVVSGREWPLARTEVTFVAPLARNASNASDAMVLNAGSTPHPVCVTRTFFVRRAIA